MNNDIKNPEIRIQYSRLLDGYFKQLFDFKKESELISDEAIYEKPDDLESKIASFKHTWSLKEPVLTYIQELLHLNFYKSVIDVYVVGNMKGGISLPIVISGRYDEEAFTDALIHELVHDLISDNKQKVDMKEILPSLAPNEARETISHVVVFAVLTKVYLDYFKNPERLNQNKSLDLKSPGYLRAWEIVEEAGADVIIEKFTAHYK